MVALGAPGAFKGHLSGQEALVITLFELGLGPLGGLV